MHPVFDGHNDALTSDDHALIASGRPAGRLGLPTMRAGGMRGAIFAVFTSVDGRVNVPVRRDDGVLEFEYGPPLDHVVAAADATAVAGRLFALERGGHLRIARAIEDLDAARWDGGPPMAVLHLEGAEAIDPRLEALELWYAAGLRSLGPVWSRANAFGHGVPFVFPSSPDIGPGLTRAGRALVQRCAELGILIDVSHLNQAGFWDVARLEPGPIVASHAAAHALCPASRNLTDVQLDEIGRSGGLVGIVFATSFLRPDFAENPDTPLELIVEHARYVADRIGADHVAFGSDFDGAIVPASLDGGAAMPKLLEALRDAGFTRDEVAAIAWENWRRVLAAWWRD
jgi:membrane dipeptidase